MNKDFLIIPPNTITTKSVIKIVDNLMDNKKIRLSFNDYFIYGVNNQLILNINQKNIRGRILSGGSSKEIKIVEDIIDNICNDKIYVHFYDGSKFISDEKIIVVWG